MRDFLPTRRDWFLASLIVLIGLGIANVALPLNVLPKFQRIYEDISPGKPLPPLTNFVIFAHIPWALAALIWPIAGIIAFSRRHPATGLILNLGALFLFPLTGMMILALYLPTVGAGDIFGLSEAPLTNAAPAER